MKHDLYIKFGGKNSLGIVEHTFERLEDETSKQIKERAEAWMFAMLEQAEDVLDEEVDLEFNWV